MDDPNVKLAKLTNSMSENGNELLDIGTCLLHNVRNTFKKVSEELVFGIDQIGVDIHSFVKLSSRREDYASMDGVTNLLAKCVLKHSSHKLSHTGIMHFDYV